MSGEKATIGPMVVHESIDVYDAKFGPVEYVPSVSAFRVDVLGSEVKSPHMDGLREAAAIMYKKKRAKVSIRFVSPGGRSGAATSVHLSMGKPTIEWDNGRKETAEITNPLRPDVDMDELRRLRDSHIAATEAWEAFVKANRLDSGYNGAQLSRIVRRAIQEAAEAAVLDS